MFLKGTVSQTNNISETKSATFSHDLSKRIIAIKFPMIVMIVFGHNLINGDLIDGKMIEFVIPDYLNVFRLVISGILAQSTVALFFFLSGYFLFLKEQSFTVTLRKKVKGLLIPYLLVNSLSVLFYFTVQTFSNQYYQSPEVYIRNFNWLDWIDVYCGCFTARSPFPLVYPLWFVRDLFIMSLAFIPIKKCINKFPVGYVMILIILWIYGPSFTLINYEGLLFFSLGYYFLKYGYSIDAFDKVAYRDIFILYAITAFLELRYIDRLFGIDKFNAIIGFILFLKVSRELIAKEKRYEILKFLAGFSFFIFIFHEPVLNIIRSIWVRMFPMQGIYVLIQYVNVVFLAVFVVLAAGILIKKYIPFMYNLLTGSRS